VNRLAISTLLLVLIGGLSVRADDTWLIADSNAINAGEPLWVSLVSGEVFPFGDAVTDPGRVAAFVDRCAAGVRRISDFAPDDGGLSCREALSQTGVHVLGCALAPRTVGIDARAFLDYMAQEHALGVLGVQDDEGTGADPVWESYTKFTKTVVEVYPVDPTDESYREPLGHRFEIIPLSNPCRWREGEAVRLQVLLDGYPWPDVFVSIGREGSETGAYVAQARTDADGIATVTLPSAGHWFARAHLIRPCNVLGRAEWESFWASLSFRVGGQVDVSRMLRRVRAACGELDPWVVAGYRVGQRALRELALPEEGDDSLAVHGASAGIWGASAAQGVVAATSGLLDSAARPLLQDGRDVAALTVVDPRTGGALQFRFRQEFIHTLSDATAGERETLSLRVALLSDEEMFSVVEDPRGVMTASLVPRDVSGLSTSDEAISP
jgi:hypothetical protein